MDKKILILKNDRAGDLFTSLTLISSILSTYKNIKIYLSELNYGFSFLFNKANIKKINFDLSIINKVLIFFDIFLNKYDKIYILTPKSFYFILPLIFRRTKFYAVVYDSSKSHRPSKYLRKFIYKYKIISRKKINLKSYRELQCDLIDENVQLDIDHNGLSVPHINNKLKNILPDQFILFQFRYLFFKKLGWGIKEFNFLMNEINKKHKFILFCSDIENNEITKKYNDYFLSNFSIINVLNYSKKKNDKNPNIFYLENIDSKNLFFVLKESSINVAKEGLFSHISFFHKKKNHNLFNFSINSKQDIIHEKISYSEWCKGMKFSFSFLSSDINKAAKKILKNI